MLLKKATIEKYPELKEQILTAKATEPAAIKSAATDDNLDTRWISAGVSAIMLPVARLEAKAAVGSFLEWAGENVGYDGEYLNKDGLMNHSGASFAWEDQMHIDVPAEKGWYEKYADQSLFAGLLSLNGGIAYIEKMIDEAKDTREVRSIFWYKGENASPKWTCTGWDTNYGISGNEMLSNFGFTGNLKDWIMAEISVMAVKADLEANNKLKADGPVSIPTTEEFSQLNHADGTSDVETLWRIKIIQTMMGVEVGSKLPAPTTVELDEA